MITSELAWKLQDYLDAGQEPPERCISNPDTSEGEMMTADEIEEFIKDSIATLRILADKQSPRYDTLAEAYHADLKYLLQVGQIGEDDYNNLTDQTNLHF